VTAGDVVNLIEPVLMASFKKTGEIHASR